MQYKLIAMDMDGTLLNSDRQISARTKKALFAAKDKGVIITLATGRMYASAKPFAEELALDVPLITYNGALVKNAITEEVYRHNPIPYEVALRIVKLAESGDFHINLYLHDKLYVKEINDYTRLYMSISQMPAHPVGVLSGFFTEAPTKILIIGEAVDLSKLAKMIKQEIGNEVEVTKSHTNFLEVMSYKSNKGRALEELVAEWGITSSEVMAFGDNYNDLMMIKYAGLGVAMGNAPAEVREMADLVADTNDQEGLAKVIERLVL